jgi:uroporphyrin-III C-methyltransferase/precorrin-2 dehydrogenase/sirohydrochlorin ferrochelatase
MGYFPFFIDIKGKKGLVIGGGRIAEHKISKLLAYEPELTVVARKVSDSIKSIEGINIIEREFVNSDLDGCSLLQMMQNLTHMLQAYAANTTFL